MVVSFESNSISRALRSVKWRARIAWFVSCVIWFVSWSNALICSFSLLRNAYAAAPFVSLGESVASLP